MSSNNQRSREIPRREFLTSMTAGAASAVVAQSMLAPQRVVGASAAWKLRLSASSINFQSLPVEQACQRIVQLVNHPARLGVLGSRLRKACG